MQGSTDSTDEQEEEEEEEGEEEEEEKEEEEKEEEEKEETRGKKFFSDPVLLRKISLFARMLCIAKNYRFLFTKKKLRERGHFNASKF